MLSRAECADRTSMFGRKPSADAAPAVAAPEAEAAPKSSVLNKEPVSDPQVERLQDLTEAIQEYLRRELHANGELKILKAWLTEE